MSILHYNIAGHIIAIETLNSDATAALLSDFHPFIFRGNNPQSERSGSINGTPGKRNEILFQLSGNTPIATPRCQPDHDFKWNGICYALYSTNGGRIITMKRGWKINVLFATHNWRYLYTDLTLIKKKEKRFLKNLLIWGIRNSLSIIENGKNKYI